MKEIRIEDKTASHSPNFELMATLEMGLGGSPSTQVRIQQRSGWYPEDHLRGPDFSLTQVGWLYAQRSNMFIKQLDNS